MSAAGTQTGSGKKRDSVIIHFPEGVLELPQDEESNAELEGVEVVDKPGAEDVRVHASPSFPAVPAISPPPVPTSSASPPMAAAVKPNKSNSGSNSSLLDVKLHQNEGSDPPASLSGSLHGAMTAGGMKFRPGSASPPASPLGQPESSSSSLSPSEKSKATAAKTKSTSVFARIGAWWSGDSNKKAIQATTRQDGRTTFDTGKNFQHALVPADLLVTESTPAGPGPGDSKSVSPSGNVLVRDDGRVVLGVAGKVHVPVQLPADLQQAAGSSSASIESAEGDSKDVPQAEVKKVQVHSEKFNQLPMDRKLDEKERDGLTLYDQSKLTYMQRFGQTKEDLDVESDKWKVYVISNNAPKPVHSPSTPAPGDSKSVPQSEGKVSERVSKLPTNRKLTDVEVSSLDKDDFCQLSVTQLFGLLKLTEDGNPAAQEPLKPLALEEYRELCGRFGWEPDYEDRLRLPADANQGNPNASAAESKNDSQAQFVFQSFRLNPKFMIALFLLAVAGGGVSFGVAAVAKAGTGFKFSAALAGTLGFLGCGSRILKCWGVSEVSEVVTNPRPVPKP